jgi:hypothetical protein
MQRKKTEKVKEKESDELRSLLYSGIHLNEV